MGGEGNIVSGQPPAPTGYLCFLAALPQISHNLDCLQGII